MGSAQLAALHLLEHLLCLCQARHLEQRKPVVCGNGGLGAHAQRLVVDCCGVEKSRERGRGFSQTNVCSLLRWRKLRCSSASAPRHPSSSAPYSQPLCARSRSSEAKHSLLGEISLAFLSASAGFQPRSSRPRRSCPAASDSPHLCASPHASSNFCLHHQLLVCTLLQHSAAAAVQLQDRRGMGTSCWACCAPRWRCLHEGGDAWRVPEPASAP